MTNERSDFALDRVREAEPISNPASAWFWVGPQFTSDRSGPRYRACMIRVEDVRAWEYPLQGGWKVLAGKTDEDNEALSLRVARANDFWFHVHGCPGSHVILQGPEGEEPEKALLKIAAGIAAYHSKARAAGVVPVSCTRAQNVTKPRGAKPGTVQIRKETTIKVRPGLPPV